MIHCTQIDKLNMHYIAKYQYVKLLHFLRVHHKWVFNSNDSHKNTFTRYLFVIVIGLMWNVIIMYSTVYWLNWWYIYSQALVVLVVPVSNFLLNHFWTFNKK